MPPLYQILTQLGTMWPYQDSPLILILEQMTGESRNAMCAVERQSFVLRARELGYPEPCYALALAISRSPCGKVSQVRQTSHRTDRLPVPARETSLLGNAM